MRIFHILLAAALLLLPSTPVFAYGQTGHRVIGEIAQRHLNADALKAVQDILGKENLWEASTWPDEMRSHPAEFWQKTSVTYHYINLPDGTDYHHAHKNPSGDAYTALTQFTMVLKDPTASKDDKALALRFVVHLVGDLHQPLHVGRAEDRGGNSIKVTYFGEERNLHSVWDTALIMSQNLSFSEWVQLLDRADSAEIATIQKAGPKDWINEGLELRKAAYDIGDGNFGYNYVFTHTPTIKRQLLKGGLRLAKYLNDHLGSNN